MNVYKAVNDFNACYGTACTFEYMSINAVDDKLLYSFTMYTKESQESLFAKLKCAGWQDKGMNSLARGDLPGARVHISRAMGGSTKVSLYQDTPQ